MGAFFAPGKIFWKNSKTCKVIARIAVLLYNHNKGNKQQNERRQIDMFDALVFFYNYMKNLLRF